MDSDRGGGGMPLFMLDVVKGVSMSLSFELDDDEYGLDDLRSMDMQAWDKIFSAIKETSGQRDNSMRLEEGVC